MNLLLERYCYGYPLPYRRPTEGRFFVGEHLLWSLEDPWADNKPFDSCVPDGVYDLVPHDSPKHPDTWALVNPELDIYHLPHDIPLEKRGKGRFGILIHAGNFEADVEGCIAPGKSPALVNDRFMVAHSKTAMELIRRVLGVGTRHTLTIRAFRGAHLFE